MNNIKAIFSKHAKKEKHIETFRILHNAKKSIRPITQHQIDQVPRTDASFATRKHPQKPHNTPYNNSIQHSVEFPHIFHAQIGLPLRKARTIAPLWSDIGERFTTRTLSPGILLPEGLTIKRALFSARIVWKLSRQWARRRAISVWPFKGW